MMPMLCRCDTDAYCCDTDVILMCAEVIGRNIVCMRCDTGVITMLCRCDIDVGKIRQGKAEL